MALPVQWTPYQVPQSLWAVIELYAPTVELSEIKHIIGEDIIEQCNELNDEIHMLLDIWRSEAHEPTPVKKAQSLPEPPLVRQQMISQIQYFISNLDETKNHLLKGFLNEKKDICDYATKTGCRSSMSTSSSQEGRMTPSRPNSSRKSALSVTDISVYRDNISAFDIDKIVKNIQEAFELEQRMLKDDIDFLQDAISDQHVTKNTLVREPTLSELKVFANELETKVMDVSQPVFNDVSAKRPSSPFLKSLPKPSSSTTEESAPKDFFKKLPELSKSKLSWRQRTLKKVNVPFRGDSSFLRDIEIRNSSPTSAATEHLVPGLAPKPPPPRTAFEQH